jgi:membrane protease YdiL (CAAX protease family)
MKPQMDAEGRGYQPLTSAFIGVYLRFLSVLLGSAPFADSPPSHFRGEKPDQPLSRAPRRESLAVALVGMLLLGLLAFYLYADAPLQERYLMPRLPLPEDFYDERFLVVNAILLLWLPLLFVFWGLRADAGEFGMRPGNLRQGWVLAAVGFALMLPLLVAAARQPAFLETYPLRRLIREQPGMFLYWELTYGFYFFLWEWFFRGFLLFGLRRGFGWHAIWLQSIPFGLLHWGKPPLELISAFPGGILMGLLAWRTGSFLPCFALHWAIAATMDGLAHLFRGA